MVPPLQPSVARRPTRVAPRLDAALLLLLSSAGLATLVLQGPGPFIGAPASLATARTVVAVAVALLLAAVRRRVACPELSWIAYLALVFGGIALIFEGLPSGQPLLLLLSFVVYGAGLILVSRLKPPAQTRTGAPSAPGGDPS